MPNRKAAWRSIPGSSSIAGSCALTRSVWTVATLRRTPIATREGTVMSEQLAVWPTLFLLGAYHGINPGMGWLFAVALGMQEKSSRAVWRALVPISVGHAVAIGVMVALAGLVQAVLPLRSLKIGVAVILFAFGFYHLFHHRHPRFGGMQVGFGDLAI